MSIDTLEDLYLEQLKDIHSANRQALAVTKDMAKAATDHGLVAALSAGAEGILQGMTTLEQIANGHDEAATGETCKGMQGLVEEARAHALEETFGEDATKDAMIITQYQRLVHYGIAGYGCLVAFASRLDLGDDEVALQACLDRTYDGDRTMTAIATGRVNDGAIV